jgi:hypothetical protein
MLCPCCRHGICRSLFSRCVQSFVHCENNSHHGLLHSVPSPLQKFGPDAEAAECMSKGGISATQAVKSYCGKLTALVQSLWDSFKMHMTRHNSSVHEGIAKAQSQLKGSWTPASALSMDVMALEACCRDARGRFVKALHQVLTPLLTQLSQNCSSSRQAAILACLQPCALFIRALPAKSDQLRTQYSMSLSFADTEISCMSVEDIQSYALQYQQFDAASNNCFWSLWCPLEQVFTNLGVPGESSYHVMFLPL